MADSISSLGGRSGAATHSTRPASDGRGRPAQPTRGGKVWEGNINGFRGRVNLSGPFDPDAPRGTYLDILV